MESQKQQTENGNASDSARLINMQSKPTQNTSQHTETMETQQKLIQNTFQTLICSVGDYLVRHSALLENGEASKIPEATCFLTLLEYLNAKSLQLLSLKTSKAYSVTKKGILLESSFNHWLDWGITLNGWCLTAKISKQPRIEKECSLLDFIEKNPNKKYYLSERTLNGLMKRIRKGWNSSMTETIKAKEFTRYQELLQQYPQAKQEEIIFRLLQKYIRRLTPIETERLQGFPSGFTSGMSETQRYTQCGNAVTVNVIEAIIKSIRKNNME